MASCSNRVVEDSFASAFIMSDDADWDVRLLSQVPEFAECVRAIASIPASKQQFSSYGDDWDILWLGHCGDVLPENDDRRYIIENDQTMAPKENQLWLLALKD